MTTRRFLLQITHSAYDGDEMSRLSDVFAREWVPPDDLIRDPEHDLTEEQAQRKPAHWHRSILEILLHVADCKVMYLTQAFGSPPEPFPAKADTLPSTLEYLAATQRYLLVCLERLDEEALAQPVPTTCHGESAAHLFWVLAQHDVYHGSQIGVLREAMG